MAVIGYLEPDARSFGDVVAASQAISLKRIADALDAIAACALTQTHPFKESENSLAGRGDAYMACYLSQLGDA